jgi:MazG family protein
VSERAEIQEAVGRLDELTRRLRRECPWDREQDERTIVPHTVEEAYELADAANAGDDAKLLDELGDVLFQVHFLSLLLEERGAGDLAAVAEHCRQKLIRRHPHVFGEVEVAGAADVLRNWDAIKRTEPGRERAIFGDVPENLPALLHARKLQRRAASAGLDVEEVPFDALHDLADALEGSADEREPAFATLGDLLFAATNVARKLHLDPELALRSSAARFQAAVERAEELATGPWEQLGADEKLSLYARARYETQ